MSNVGTSLREAGDSLSTAVRNRDLRRVMLAFGGSMIGDWAYATAVTVWAYGIGGATAVGVWGATRLGLMAIATPFVSTLADRFPRKRVMVVTDLLRVALVSLSAVIIAVNGSAWLVFLLATLAALVGTPFRPALAAILPRLARSPHELTAANGAGSTLESLAFFIGPALGALLLKVADVEIVFALNAATFLLSAYLVSGIHERVPTANEEAESRDGSEPPSSFLRDSMLGFGYIWRDKDIRAVTVVYLLQTVVAGASLVFVIVLAVDLDLGPEGVGYLDSVFGIGAITGGLLSIVLATRNRLASDFWVGVLLWAIPLLVYVAWPSLWPMCIALFVMGAANPVVDVNATTILQRTVPDQFLGRVFGALESGLIATMSFGAVLMPLLIAWLGLRGALAVLACGIAVLIAPAYPRLRRLDSTLREPAELATLRAVPIFAPLSLPLLDQLARQLERIEVPAGSVIIREGDEGDRFYVVESGTVEATHAGTVLSVAGPGEPFGEIALLRDVPRTATVTATTDTVLYALTRADFLAAVTGDDEARLRADDLASRRIPTY
ncbi:MAG: MFS transporter [Candidatus Nanopelagicales bacterium]